MMRVTRMVTASGRCSFTELWSRAHVSPDVPSPTYSARSRRLPDLHRRRSGDFDNSMSRFLSSPLAARPGRHSRNRIGRGIAKSASHRCLLAGQRQTSTCISSSARRGCTGARSCRS
jgi:hypothetical protein